jgi:transcriptional regulator with XRE-family HTH domain
LNTMGKNTKRFRLNKGLTQHMLALRAGVTRGYISLLESGKKEPAISTLYKIADALGVGVGDLFEDGHKGFRFQLIKKRELQASFRKNSFSNNTYKPLAEIIKNKMIDPFVLRIDPGEQRINAETAHKGEEFCLLLAGRIKFIYGDKKFFLQEGDAMYFDSSVVHAPVTLGQKPAFLLVLAAGR